MAERRGVKDGKETEGPAVAPPMLPAGAREKRSRTPSHILRAIDRDGRPARVGAGWLGEEGRVYLTLDAFVVLRQADIQNLTLFPNDLGKPA